MKQKLVQNMKLKGLVIGVSLFHLLTFSPLETQAQPKQRRSQQKVEQQQQQKKNTSSSGMSLRAHLEFRMSYSADVYH